MIKSLILLFSILFLVSCGKKDLVEVKPTLLVSVAPYQSLVERIAGDTFLVKTVVPPGANPHAYEPTAKEIGALGQGILWFRIGESFEKKIYPVLQENNQNLTDCDLREGLFLIHESACHCHAELHEDRHFWLSPKRLIPQVQTITNSLSKRFPDQKKTFQINQAKIIGELEMLDIEIETILKKTKRRSFLVSHPAFAYFCKDYNLEQLSIESEGKEPTSRHLTHLMELITASRAKIAIGMPQHSNKGVELIAGKLGLDLHMIDPYGRDYFQTMRHLAHLLVDDE